MQQMSEGTRMSLRTVYCETTAYLINVRLFQGPTLSFIYFFGQLGGRYLG